MIASIQGRCPYDVVLDRFAVSDGRGSSIPRRWTSCSRSLAAAQEVTVHNLKPLFLAAIKQGIEPHPAFFDTMLAVYLINPARKEYGIQSILSEFLDVDVNGDAQKESLARSAFQLPRLKEELLKRLEEMGLRELFFDIEMPLVEVLARMECLGVRVDRKALVGLSTGFRLEAQYDHSSHLRSRRGYLQHQLAAAARAHTLSQAEPAPREEDEDLSFHG